MKVKIYISIFLNLILLSISANCQNIVDTEKYKSKYIGGVRNGINIFSDKYQKRKPNFVIKSRNELLNALKKANPGDLLYIPDEIKIDLSGLKNISIPSGITIKGDRGIKNSKGALLYTSQSGVQPLFEVNGDNVTFYGLRIRGDDGEILNGPDAFKDKVINEKDPQYLVLYNKNMYATPVSSGIATFANNLTVENCEIFQWTNNGVYFKKGSKGGVVRYCFIHNNQRFGLGYGITTNQAEILIEGNLFDFNKHSIASTGRVGSIYIVRGNIFKENGNYSWAIDMHGGKDKGENNNISGTKLSVFNNIFYLKGKGKAVVIRGRPVEPSVVYDNTIIYLDNRVKYGKNPFSQYNAKGNFKYFDNEIIEKK